MINISCSLNYLLAKAEFARNAIAKGDTENPDIRGICYDLERAVDGVCARLRDTTLSPTERLSQIAMRMKLTRANTAIFKECRDLAFHGVSLLEPADDRAKKVA